MVAATGSRVNWSASGYIMIAGYRIEKEMLKREWWRLIFPMEDDEKFIIRPLQYNDLPFLVALEQASFPPNEAATLEKVETHLTS
jgi:glyoxylate utilization-related uncharacterized protein